MMFCGSANLNRNGLTNFSGNLFLDLIRFLLIGPIKISKVSVNPFGFFDRAAWIISLSNLWEMGGSIIDGFFTRKTVVYFYIVFVVIYLSWRLFFTLNPYQPIASGLFLLADLISGISSILFYLTFTVSRFEENKRIPYAGQDYRPSVDVLIPTLNEGTEILEHTVNCCKAMGYPHSTYLLDDGNRPEILDLAKKAGIYYISRKTNLHAKAGNLNNALKAITGELVAVFDADFAPESKFLDNLTGYFKDSSVAVVQTPQMYHNVDSFQHLRMSDGHIYSDQDFFMRTVLPARNIKNAAYWIGTNAVLRRQAIDDVGGFSTESVTEDLLTSIRLHENGWKIVYIDEPMALGLAPETPSQYFIQRRRWAQGAIQVLVKHNPLFSRNLSIPQRLSYFASVIHFIDGATKSLFYLFPALFFIAGITPVTPSPEIIGVMALYYLLSLLFRYNITGRKLYSFIGDSVFDIIRIAPYLSAFSAFIPGKKITFAVTPKKNGTGFTIKSVIGPVIVFALNLAVILLVVSDGKSVLKSDLFTFICFVWCFCFCSLAGLAMFHSFSLTSKKQGISSKPIFRDVSKHRSKTPAFLVWMLLFAVPLLCVGSTRKLTVTDNFRVPVLSIPQNLEKPLEIKQWLASEKPFSDTKLSVLGVKDGLTNNLFLINGSTPFVRLFDYLDPHANVERFNNFYLYSAIDCGKTTNATLVFDGSCNYKLWLNGELLEERIGKHNINKVGDRYVNVVLKKGINMLQIKINRGENLKSWDFVCEIAPTNLAKNIFRSNYQGDFVVNPIAKDSLTVYTGPYDGAQIRIIDNYGSVVMLDSVSSLKGYTVSLPANMSDGFYVCFLDLGPESIAEDIYKGDYPAYIGSLHARILSSGLADNGDIKAGMARTMFLSDETVGDESVDESRRLDRNRVFWGRSLASMVAGMSGNNGMNRNSGTYLLSYPSDKEGEFFHFVAHVGDTLDQKKKIPVVFVVPYDLKGGFMPEDWYLGNLDQIVNDNNLADKYGFALVWLYSRGKDYSPTSASEDLHLALERMRSLYDIDTTRMFIMGDCEGGRRAMALVRDNPGLFRGIATTSPLTLLGNGDLAPIDFAGNLADIPIIIQHGKFDEVADIANSLEFIEVANKLGFYPKLMVIDNSHITFNRDYRNYAFEFFDSINKISFK